MMKKYNVTVNGKTYTVEVEETDAVYTAPTTKKANTVTPATQAPSVVSPAYAPAPTAAKVQEKKEEVIPTTSGKIEVKSPMAGTILRSLVSVGEKITKNQGVMILEAMKMENEVVAPEAGVVATINIKNGDSVKTGDILLTIN